MFAQVGQYVYNQSTGAIIDQMSVGIKITDFSKYNNWTYSIPEDIAFGQPVLSEWNGGAIYIRGDYYYDNIPTHGTLFYREGVVYAKYKNSKYVYEILEPKDKKSSQFSNIKEPVIYKVSVMPYGEFCGVTINNNFHYYTQSHENIVNARDDNISVSITFGSGETIQYYTVLVGDKYMLKSNCGKQIGLTGMVDNIVTHLGKTIRIGEYNLVISSELLTYTLPNDTVLVFQPYKFLSPPYGLYLIGSTYYIDSLQQVNNIVHLMAPLSVTHGAPRKTKSAALFQ